MFSPLLSMKEFRVNIDGGIFDVKAIAGATWRCEDFAKRQVDHQLSSGRLHVIPLLLHNDNNDEVLSTMGVLCVGHALFVSAPPGPPSPPGNP